MNDFEVEELIEFLRKLICIENEVAELKSRIANFIAPRAKYGCWLESERKVDNERK